MRAWENNCQISQKDIFHMKFYNFTCVFKILVKFDIYPFLGHPWELVFGVIIDN